MSNSTSLWIPDSSPLFFYSPANSYFSNLNLNSWIGKSTNSPQVSEFNVTFPDDNNNYHSSFGNVAVILPSIYATAFTPIFKASEKYNTTFELASYGKIPWASGRSWKTSNDDFNLQTFTLWFDCLDVENQCNKDEIDFLGAWINTKFVPDNTEIDIVEIDDSSSIIKYEGFSPINQNNKIVEIDSKIDFEKTLSMTSKEGSKATISFNGASIEIYGVTCSKCGEYNIKLNEQISTFSSFNNLTIHNSLLFFNTNLDTNNLNTIEIESKNGGLILDKIQIKGPKGAVNFIGNQNDTTTTFLPNSNPTSTSTSNSTSISGNSNNINGNNISGTSNNTPNAGVIVGAILGSISGIAFLYYLCRKIAPSIKKKSNKKLNSWDEANLLQNMKNEQVHVTTAANQRYVYPGLIAHSNLKK